jgi:hypothetical protein
LFLDILVGLPSSRREHSTLVKTRKKLVSGSPRSKKRHDGRTLELAQGADESSTVFTTSSSGQTSLLPGRPGR